jgi:hypothetical protein
MIENNRDPAETTLFIHILQRLIGKKSGVNIARLSITFAEYVLGQKKSPAAYGD